MSANNRIEIRLSRVNKTYRAGDVVSGVVAVVTKDGLSHQGLTMTVEGSVSLQLSAKNVGVFEAFYNSIKPQQLVNYSFELQRGGKFPAGTTEIPFEFPLKPLPGTDLYETYHGVFVNIQYSLKVDMKRGAFSKDLQKVSEFVVEGPPQNTEKKRIDFNISPDSLQNVSDRQKVPNFLVEGHIDSAVCCITEPLSGQIVVKHSTAPIKSVELQLVRVETCGCLEGYAKDPTEIQNIQVAEGDVARGVPIPLHMVFPRLFTCPTLQTDNFKVEFEVNVVIVLKTSDLITENFPLKLVRA